MDETRLTIGNVTSGTMSPSLNQGVGLGYVEIGHHKPGTKVYIKIRGKELEAEITKPPFL
jgi:aminomethyltransferase